VHCHDVILTYKTIEFVRSGLLLIVRQKGGMEDDEKAIVVSVDFWALDACHAVFDGKGVEQESFFYKLHVGMGRFLDINPHVRIFFAEMRREVIYVFQNRCIFILFLYDYVYHNYPSKLDTIRLTVLPSAFPFTFSITVFITFPIWLLSVASSSLITSVIIFLSSSSDICSGI